ncbi:MAG: hypothetical protein ACH0QD_05855 [Tepidibacillus sp.]
MKSKIWLIGLIILLIMIIVSVTYLIKQEPVPPEETDWNQPDERNPTSEIDSLYEQGKVPKLEKLMVNNIFIQTVYFNRIPYFLGFSSDGHYAAFIHYNDTGEVGYLVQIYDTWLGDLTYSFFIPDQEKIVESEEIKLAQEVLDHGFNIQVFPRKLNWKNGMKYKNGQETWVFQELSKQEKSKIKLSNNRSQEEWLFPGLADEGEKYIDLFSFPGKTNWLAFVQTGFDSEETNRANQFKPIFIQLEKLTVKNSEKGKDKEADNWLYGNFKFIYDQGVTGVRKGYIAISTDNSSLKKEIGQKKNITEQWVYLDPKGTMIWYGSPQGIFNRDTKPIHPQKGYYYYQVNITMNGEKDILQYFVVDQYESSTNKLIRTIEFQWDDKVGEMRPIQPI